MVYFLVLFTIALMPFNGLNELMFRYKIVDAVTTVTDDETEQRQLLSLARYETGFHERLAAPNCECHKGECDGGKARGTWQIIPRGRDEKAKLCISLVDDAAIALVRLRETVRACRRSPSNERFAIWYRGRCDSEEGKKMSKISWVE